MPEKEGPEERSPSRDESVEEGRTESLRPPAGTGPVPDSWGGASPEASAEDRTTWFERSGRVPPIGEDSGEVEVGPRRFGPFVIVEELGRGG
ncbi:MAG: hypothetical protein KDD47_05280, partial [Acidobacteria bacterium]|nr:hypothetical protein [Acidobacteriota bacterium]